MAAGSTSASSRRRDLINVARLVDRLETAQMADAGQTGEDTAYYHAMATLSVRPSAWRVCLSHIPRRGQAELGAHSLSLSPRQSIAYARQVLERASSSSPGQDAGAAQQ
jgi:hypothetical protein